VIDETIHAFNDRSDIAGEDGLKEIGLGKELQSIVESSGGGHDLSSTSMDGVSMTSQLVTLNLISLMFSS